MIWQADTERRLPPRRAAVTYLTGLNGMYKRNLLAHLGGWQRG
jgi:hypothetical protein